MEHPIIKIACIHLNPHALTMPMAMSSHFQGSVIQTNRGIHDANMVTPAAKANTANSLVKLTRLITVMVMIRNAVPAVTKGMAMEFINNIPAIRIRLS